MIQGTNDTRYSFVNGIIRAREVRLLTKSHFDRLIAGDLNRFSTILSDSPYAVYDDITAGLEHEEKKIKDFVLQYCITPSIVHMIDWPEQMHNVKIKVKQGEEHLFYETTGSDVETWPEVQTAIEQYALNKDPFTLSSELDRILCSHLHEIATFSPFFERYFTLSMDLENIRSFFRARQFEDTKKIFQQVYLPYGTLRYGKFADNIDMELDHLSRAFFTTPYVHLIDRGAVYLEQHDSFLRLERLIEEVRLEFLIQARRMTFGVEPLYAYYHFKMNEIKKLRQVYWGKRNELPLEQLKESIPDVW